MSDDAELPMPGALPKIGSLPKLNIEEDHPRHRYYTPQLSKRKPFLPPKPSENSVRRILRQNGLHEDTAEHDDSEEDQPPSQSENERLEEVKRDLVATRVLHIPKQNTPELPSNGKQSRRSDTHLQRTYLKDFRSPSASHVFQSADSYPTKQGYYTPQPKRKHFNPDHNQYVNQFDGVQGSEKSRVKRLADVYKRGGSLDSLDATSSPGQRSFSSQFSSPSPTASPRIHSSLSPQSTTAGTPSSTSPVTNTQNSPLSGVHTEKIHFLSPSASHTSESSAASEATKQRYYTPQPKRKQFNLDHNKCFNEFDVAQGSTESSVKRLADIYKRGGSSHSSDSTPSPGQLSISSKFSSTSSTASPQTPSSLSPHSTEENRGMQKTRSLPKLNIKEMIKQNGDHQGYGYLTPQPSKRKPFLPLKSLGNSVRRMFRQNGLSEDIVDHDESEEDQSPSVIQRRLEEAKPNLVATTVPLTPERKSSGLLSNRRSRGRKSDAHSLNIKQLHKTNSKGHRTPPRKPIQRSRPQSTLIGPICYQNMKPLRKSGTSIRNHNAASTKTNLIKSPDRKLDHIQAYGDAYQAEIILTPRRLSPTLRNELFNPIVQNQAESVNPMKVSSIPVKSPLSLVSEVPRTNNNIGHTNKSLMAHIAGQKSGIDKLNTFFTKSKPTTTGSYNDPSSPSSGYISSPSPTSSPKHRHSLLRKMSSVSSIASMFASREVLSDLFLSERGTNRHLKAIAGFITGLILGMALFLGLYYGLKYGIIASVVITALSTVLMSVSLAFTVRARCVALLMLPTLCTQRGRAAFLAIVVLILFNGPINNVFLNANEVSSSMSCSAELAYNQSQLIKEVAAEVFDQYVINLEKTVAIMQQFADGVENVFHPVIGALDTLRRGLTAVKNEIEKMSGSCNKIAGQAKHDCLKTSIDINKAYHDCKAKLPILVDNLCEIVSGAGDVTGTLCDGYQAGWAGLCIIPNEINHGFEDALATINGIANEFSTDIEFSHYWDNRHNQSRTFENIQQAVENDIQNTVDAVNYIFSILDMLRALSVIYLFYCSYQYHTHYRTRDNFDNFYITNRFKELDAKRKTKGKTTLLPLKKSERVRLIDVTSLRLSKLEKGLFKIGLAKLSAHICIASVLFVIDYGLYYLLELIKKYGSVRVDISGESGLQLDIKGDGALSAFIQDVFGTGFEIDNSYNVSFNTIQCLPNGSPPNQYLAVGVALAYFLVLLTILFQAYVLRLRRHVAEYFYPERELERLNFIYNDTLRKRQTLFKFLKDVIKQKQKIHVATQKVSLVVYITDRYPTLKQLFVFLRITTEPKICFGCDSDDDGTFRHCDGSKCTALYCDECLIATNDVCAICSKHFKYLYDSSE